MSNQEVLDLLLNLPYKTIKLFDGEKVTQETVVNYGEIIKQINLVRREVVKDKAKEYLREKLSNKKE